MKLSLIFVALIITLTSTQPIAPTCSSSSHCNKLRTFKGFRCSSSSCVVYGEAAYKTVASSSQVCKASFRFSGSRCGSYAALGCTIPIGEILVRRCMEGSRDSNGKCTPPSPTAKPNYSKLNARCDLTASPQERCPSDQICLNKVCRRKLNIGDYCLGSDIGCVGGTTCDQGRCTLFYSKGDLSPCGTDSVCNSGDCSSGICLPNAVNECYSNSDCVGDAVCKKPSATSTTDVRGKCFNPSKVAQDEYNRCQHYNCYKSSLTGDFTTKCLAKDKCLTAYVKTKCASNCLKKPEDRYQTNDPWVYDCEALTRKAMTSAQCELVNQYEKCEAVFNYNASNTVRGISRLINIQMVVAFLFVLFLIH